MHPIQLTVDSDQLQGLLSHDEALRQLLETLLNQMLQAEVTEHLHAQPYERTEERAGHRNGSKPCQLTTRAGTLHLLLPHLTGAGYQECLRATHAAQDIPPTCPLPEPAGRIDYLWADPLLAKRIQGCEAICDKPGCPVNRASDHRPILARFARVAGGGMRAEPETDARERVTEPQCEMAHSR